MNNFFLRPANKNDLLFLWKLRNEKTVRQNSFKTNLIPLKKHKKWFAKKMKGGNSLIFIAVKQNARIGFVRFEKQKNKNYEVSMAIVPKQRGKGMSSKILKQACHRLFSEENAKSILAFIKPTNKAAVRMCLNAGFSKAGVFQKKSKKALKMELKND